MALALLVVLVRPEGFLTSSVRPRLRKALARQGLDETDDFNAALVTTRQEEEKKKLVKRRKNMTEIDRLLEAEDVGDVEKARLLARDEIVAEGIALASIMDQREDTEIEEEIALAQARRQAEIDASVVIPTGPVYDIVSLLDKFGGAEEIYANHKIAHEVGSFLPLPQLKKYLDDVEEHIDHGAEEVLEFTHASGSKLSLVGTNHFSRISRNLSRDMVRRVRPDCLVLALRFGDDSLQRMTVPVGMLQDKLMKTPPAVFRTSDRPIDRARLFQLDRVWLEAMAGWKDIGREAAWGHEFNAAFEEFAWQLRNRSAEEQSRGGVVCFGDADLRVAKAEPLEGWDRFEEGTLFKKPEAVLNNSAPRIEDLDSLAVITLRDLRLAEALRAALRTRERVVGIVNSQHMAGIKRLLLQDASIKLVSEGVEQPEPHWEDDLKDNGRAWERKILGGAAELFKNLAEDLDFAPLGTWMDAETVLELQKANEDTAASIEAEGLEVQPAAMASSDLGANFIARSTVLTPDNENDLRRWFAGENVEGEPIGEFPFENRKLRSFRPALPPTNFPEIKKEVEEVEEGKPKFAGVRARNRAARDAAKRRPA